jgi:hypothetical protein
LPKGQSFQRFFDTPVLSELKKSKASKSNLTTMRVGIYARVSTQERKFIGLQLKPLREYAKNREWIIALEVVEAASSAKQRPKREELLQAAK